MERQKKQSRTPKSLLLGLAALCYFIAGDGSLRAGEKKDKGTGNYVKWHARKHWTPQNCSIPPGTPPAIIAPCNMTNALNPGGCQYIRRNVKHIAHVRHMFCVSPRIQSLSDQGYCGGANNPDSCQLTGHYDVHTHPAASMTAACKVAPSCTTPYDAAGLAPKCVEWFLAPQYIIGPCWGNTHDCFITGCKHTWHCQTSSGSFSDGCQVKYVSCGCSPNYCRGQNDGNPAGGVDCPTWNDCIAGDNSTHCATGWHNCGGAGLTDGYCFCRFEEDYFYDPP